VEHVLVSVLSLQLHLPSVGHKTAAPSARRDRQHVSDRAVIGRQPGQRQWRLVSAGLPGARSYRAPMDDERDGADDWDPPSWDELREWLDAPEWIQPPGDDADEPGDEPEATLPGDDTPTPARPRRGRLASRSERRPQRALPVWKQPEVQEVLPRLRPDERGPDLTLTP
jgi:hypothetical protein